MGTADRKHAVVVGGGFGGLEVARCLGELPLEVTLIDRENHHLFQPLLYQVATAGLSPHEIAFPIRSTFRRRPNVRVLLGEVVGADPDEGRVSLESGETLAYDYLVISAGAKTNYFGHEEWAEHALGLKTMRDAISVRERVLMMFEAAEREPNPEVRRRLLSFVVIGGGPTGVELAGALSELGRRVLARDFRNVRADEVRVLLLEMADRVLLPFDERLSQRAKEQLEDLDVEIRTGARVTHVGVEGVQVGDELVEAAVVCWAPGVRPVSLSERLGLEVDRRGRIIVDDSCAVPGRPEVFAIGDIASFVPEGEDAPLPQLAPVAIQQGRHVARVIDRDLAGRPREPFSYRDKGIMATLGRSRAVAQRGRLRLSGFPAWIAWLVVHLFFLIGFRNRLLVLLEWFWSYAAFRRGARLVVSRYQRGQVTSLRDTYSVRLPQAVTSGDGAPAGASAPAPTAAEPRAAAPESEEERPRERREPPLLERGR